MSSIMECPVIDRAAIRAAMDRLDEGGEELINLNQYFSKWELSSMCEIEQTRLKNIKRNYLFMMEFGRS